MCFDFRPKALSLRIAAPRHLASRCHRVLTDGDVALDLADFSHVMAEHHYTRM